MAALSQITRGGRRPWPVYLLVLATSFVLLTWGLTFLGYDETILRFSLQAAPNSKLVLRPGEYVDYSRSRIVPDTQVENTFSEPNGIGTIHDRRNNKYYLGGIQTLTSKDGVLPPQPIVYDPYPAYDTDVWRLQWKGDFLACDGPRGAALDRSDARDMISVFRGNQKNFPFPAFGSYEALNMDGDICVDRCARYGAYGYDENCSASGSSQQPANIDWEKVNWGQLQSQCLEKNMNRYQNPSTLRTSVLPHPTQDLLAIPTPSASSSIQKFHSRTAVLVRTYHGISWTTNHRQYIRSLVMELSLHSGGEYEVFFLVDSKDPEYDLNDSKDVERLKNKFIPAEFHNITILFNTKILEEWYPKIEEHRPVFQHLQPTQIFSQLYPQFDYFWQFEMDGRNTGHTYHFLEQAVAFAKRQPRKYLWERNAYFYTPGVHGTWEDFARIVDESMAGRENHSVWGPVPAQGFDPLGARPPVASAADDNYEWGVGEEADLITLLPIFSAAETQWTFPNKTWNLPSNDTARRASPITMWRMSRTLLDIMHEAQVQQGIGFVSEMSAPTFALLHGLKAVHVPQPLYVDGQWTSRELARIFNPGSELPEKINGGADSIFNWDHAYDQIVYRMSYMFTTQFAEDLFRRWMGYAPDPNQYIDGSLHRDPQGRFWYDGGSLDEAKYGRLCFPPMFLHTVKNTALEKGKDMAVPV